MGELYRPTFPNGKRYIGITTHTAGRRWKTHCYEACRGTKGPLYSAMRKYGAENVLIETIGGADSWDELCALEREAIVSNGSRSPAGYNATDGGDGAPKGHSYRVGLKHTDEAKFKMSKRRKGKRLSDGHRENIRAALIGNKYNFGNRASPETKARQALAHLAGGPTRASTSGIKGVSQCKKTLKWRAHITVGGKTRELGKFDQIDAAAAARRAAEADVIARLTA